MTSSQKNSTFTRASGILLHPTSLPGKYGIGDLGPNAYWFIDLLYDHKQKLWQILPLGPTGYGNSPYQSLSAFAGNHLLISIELLIQDGLLKENEIIQYEDELQSKVDFGRVISYKTGLLTSAYNNFTKKNDYKNKKDFLNFGSENAYWLRDYAIFKSLKQHYDGKPWISWKKKHRDRDSQEIEKWVENHSIDINQEEFFQYTFYKQLKELKTYANDKNVKIIGDVPIYVAHDSVDVWANKNLFFMDKNGNLTIVAGVPPDYFSETGQLWGNPIYKWMSEKEELNKWWIERFTHLFNYLDILRLDHFRGFEAYWEIPGDAKSAINGKWVKGPGEEFFKSIIENIEPLNLIAEDLGVITKEVRNLKEKFKFPGMKIFQFGFDNSEHNKNIDLPHTYEENSAVYTGTHDNQSIKGWYENLSKKKRYQVDKYINRSKKDVFSDILEVCQGSKSVFSLNPMQDILRLDDSSIMNKPSIESNNWEWRFTKAQIQNKFMSELRDQTIKYKRD